jgi:hypothetical protein
MEYTLRYNNEALERVCRKYHVRRLELFGSWAKGEPNAASDLDLLVDYDPESGMTMFQFLDLDSSI